MSNQDDRCSCKSVFQFFEEVTRFNAVRDKKSPLIIPDYQREYVWDTAYVLDMINRVCETARQIMMDIPEDPENPEERFRRALFELHSNPEFTEPLGFFIFSENRDNNATYNYHVVDGQQRLTTITLIARNLMYNLIKDFDNLRTGERGDMCEWDDALEVARNLSKILVVNGTLLSSRVSPTVKPVLDTEVLTASDRNAFEQLVRTGEPLKKDALGRYSENYFNINKVFASKKVQKSLKPKESTPGGISAENHTWLFEKPFKDAPFDNRVLFAHAFIHSQQVISYRCRDLRSALNMFDILNSKGVDLKKSDLIKSRIQVALQNSINDPARAELEVSRVADLWRDLNDFKERGLKTDEVFHSVHHYYSVTQPVFKADNKIFALSRFDAVKQSDDEQAVIKSFHDLILHSHTCIDLQKYINGEACSNQTLIEPLLNQVDNGNYILRLLQIVLQSPTLNRQPVYTYFIHLQQQLLAEHPELKLTDSLEQTNNKLMLSGEEVTKYRIYLVRFLLKYLRELYVTDFNAPRAKYYSRAIVEPSVDPARKDESFDTNITTRMTQIEEGNPRPTSWPIFPSHPDYRSTDDADPVKLTAKFFLDQKIDIVTQTWLLVELAEEIIADPEFYTVVGFAKSTKREGQDRHLFSTNPSIKYPLEPLDKFNKGEGARLSKRPWMSVIFDAGQFNDSFWSQVAKGRYDAEAANNVETRYKSTRRVLNWLHRAYADGQLKDNWVERLYADRLTYLLEYLGVFLAFAQQEWLDTSLPGDNFQKLTMFYGENHDDTALNYHENFKAEDHLAASLKTVELNAYQVKKK